MLFNKTPKLGATIIKLIMGDVRLIKPLGVLRNLKVTIAGKDIPTDFFVINASDDEHVLVLLKYTFYPLFILDNGMNLISKSLTVLTPP